ncbi:bacterioferritin [uncultured Bacteroides sp.]|uniref:bacterioferritin n=1 Tax=uncultured Bacteroides sp. TaxID=162156 RepID=UPI002AA8AF34|nr:bacterioferritin [uncultured Bacteroides sp.]
MKGNEKLIAALNSLLADELTAINQYMVHTELCESWGYGKLHVAIRKQSIDEMRHAEWLIERIIFLDGAPTVSKLNPMKIGKTPAEMISNDYGYELTAIRDYNNAIKLSREVDDQGSLELLTKILKMEEDHADWAEVQLAQIEQMGLENYLVNQVEKSAS